MLSSLVELSLRYRFLVLLAFAGVVFLGYRAVISVPIDAFPDVTPAQVNVYTESPGLAAEDVEQLITFPVESGLAGLPNVRQIRSVSLFGLSYVAVYFEDDTDIYFARRLVMERLQEVGERLPEGYGNPEMGPNSSGLGQVLWYTLEREDETYLDAISDMDLRTVHDWAVRLTLRTAPGVDDVISWGGQERQYQIVLDPLKMISYELSFADIVQAVTTNNVQVGGQYVDLGREQYLVRGMGLIEGTRDIGDIVVKVNDGVPVFIRDIAKVQEGGSTRFGAVTRDGREVVLGMVLSRIGENAAAVVKSAHQKLDTLDRTLPDGFVINPLYDRSRLVNEATWTAIRALIEGSILVALVLFLFLGDFRCSVVVISALPMAMLIAFIFMEHMDLSANLMSLAGLAIGIGMMVDGAVVMVENSYRVMSAHHGEGLVDRPGAVLSAAREVANPITFAIAIIVVVFIPLFALEGLEGKLFKPMAFNIGFAMAGSLLISLTLIPVLAAALLKAKEEKDTWLVRGIKGIYLPILDKALRNRRPVIVAAIGLLLSALCLVPFLGREFMPTLQEGDIMWRVTSIPSISLDESIKISIDIENALAEYPEVDSTVAMIGRAEKGETVDVNYMEIYTALKPRNEWPSDHDYVSLAGAMRETLEQVAPSTVIAFTQPIQMRVEELISGVRSTLAAKLYGEDLDVLHQLSAEIRDVIGQVEGVADLSLEANRGKLQIRVEILRDRIARYGLSVEEVLDVVRSGIGNEPVATLIDGVRRFDITVGLDDDAKESISAIRRIPLRTASGAIVPLSSVASVTPAEGFSFIRREQLQRYAVIQMDVQGRDVGSFVSDANAAIESSIDLPSGYWIEWGGAFENQRRALTRLAIIVPLTIFFIFVLLYTAFNSVRYAMLIIANVPFAAIGGILVLFIGNFHISVPAVIGLIAVFGVAMLNGIVLVSFINQLRNDGYTLEDAVRRGTELRLRPVLMTASVAILGLVPMLISTGIGAETQRPLAGVVIGGLVSSTILTLILLPVLYKWIETKNIDRTHSTDTVPS